MLSIIVGRLEEIEDTGGESVPKFCYVVDEIILFQLEYSGFDYDVDICLICDNGG